MTGLQSLNTWITGQTNMIAKLIVLVVFTGVYILYQRIWHPLARFPGPFWASITDFWQFKEWWTWKQPYRLTNLHARYGPVVRYGPNKLSVTSLDAVQQIYGGGRLSMPKTAFYDAFGKPGDPNLFNVRDEGAHAIRRRICLKAFSPQAVRTYEPLINKHLKRLIEKIQQRCKNSQSFDLKEYINLFLCDVIGELMYCEDLGALQADSAECLPDHDINMYASSAGDASFLGPLVSIISLFVPNHPKTSKKYRDILSYIAHADRAVKKRASDILQGVDADREDVLTRLLNARVSEKEERFEENHVATEIFSFIIAGVHPPAATTTLLFYHLLHHPQILQKAVAEIDDCLPRVGADNEYYSSNALESGLPYLRNCVKENFRITPIFTMPLPRLVGQDEGIVIGGHTIPKGTSIAVCNYAFHHNPEVWGQDHWVFNPTRWDDASYSELSKSLFHFGAGGRQCIGKVLATTLLYKIVGTLLSTFFLELADEKEQKDALNGAFEGKVPPQTSVGISDLEGSLMVKATFRKLS